MFFGRQEFYHWTTKAYKTFAFWKTSLRKWKASHTLGENICNSYQRKDLYSEHIQLNKKTNNPMQYWAKEDTLWPIGTWIDGQKNWKVMIIQIEKKIFFHSFFFFFWLRCARGSWDLSSPTRDWTQALGSESTES